nr:hypothetical protein [Candidatus Dependentiae bacterium]
KNIADKAKIIPELQKKSFYLIDGYLKTSSSIIKIIIETETGGFKLKYTWVYDKVMKKTLFKKFE